MDTVGRRHKGGGGARPKKKLASHFSGGGRFFFLFLAWLPAPSLHSTTRTLSSRNDFSELKPSEYEPIRHYLDTTTLQVIHSIGYNSKIVVFMNPAKPGPQGDAFCKYLYLFLYTYTFIYIYIYIVFGTRTRHMQARFGATHYVLYASFKPSAVRPSLSTRTSN